MRQQLQHSEHERAAAADEAPHLRSRCLDLAFVLLEQLAQHRNDELQRESEAGELAFGAGPL